LPVLPPENATENEYLKATATEIKNKDFLLDVFQPPDI
jgi:hypothetical protein